MSYSDSLAYGGSYFGDNTYNGAPDECSRHWPTKLNEDGSCDDCINEREEDS